MGVAGGLIAERAHVNAREQTVRVYIIGIQLQDRVGLFDRFAQLLCFGTCFGQAFHDHGAIGAKSKAFL